MNTGLDTIFAASEILRVLSKTVQHTYLICTLNSFCGIRGATKTNYDNVSVGINFLY